MKNSTLQFLIGREQIKVHGLRDMLELVGVNKYIVDPNTFTYTKNSTESDLKEYFGDFIGPTIYPEYKFALINPVFSYTPHGIKFGTSKLYYGTIVQRVVFTDDICVYLFKHKKLKDLCYDFEIPLPLFDNIEL